MDIIKNIKDVLKNVKIIKAKNVSVMRCVKFVF
jgi:hypothetical protein